jgi:hypothetical protein
MSEPKHYSLEAETGRYELKGHDVDLRVANSWDELTRAFFDADKVTITDWKFANEFLSKYGVKANLKLNDALILQRNYEVVKPTRTLLYVALIAAALFVVGIVCYYLGAHQSETAVLVGGGTVVIVAVGICILFLRLGLAALKGSARVEIRSKWSMGKIANGEIELIRHGTNSEAHGE